MRRFRDGNKSGMDIAFEYVSINWHCIKRAKHPSSKFKEDRLQCAQFRFTWVNCTEVLYLADFSIYSEYLLLELAQERILIRT